ncbi:MAG: hypothetical protein J6N54_03775, partial [Bacteroidales bacterium]|nr:hypothetical protein [Bacteroidales bacterium]
MITGTNKTGIKICREDVSLTDREILDRYMGIKRIPCVMQSPLRDDDKDPSFSIYVKGDKVRWKDFGTGETDSTIGLMAKLWNVSYSDALVKIKLDQGERIPKFDLIRRYKGKTHINADSSINVRKREWKDWDR